MDETSRDKTSCRFEKKKRGKGKAKTSEEGYFSSLGAQPDSLFAPVASAKRRGTPESNGKGTERAMDRAVALRRCSVTGYIPGIPRGHGHISSSSRFPVPHTPGLPTPSRGTRAGTRNNGARVGTGALSSHL